MARPCKFVAASSLHLTSSSLKLFIFHELRLFVLIVHCCMRNFNASGVPVRWFRSLFRLQETAKHVYADIHLFHPPPYTLKIDHTRVSGANFLIICPTISLRRGPSVWFSFFTEQTNERSSSFFKSGYDDLRKFVDWTKNVYKKKWKTVCDERQAHSVKRKEMCKAISLKQFHKCNTYEKSNKDSSISIRPKMKHFTLELLKFNKFSISFFPQNNVRWVI